MTQTILTTLSFGLSKVEEALENKTAGIVFAPFVDEPLFIKNYDSENGTIILDTETFDGTPYTVHVFSTYSEESLNREYPLLYLYDSQKLLNLVSKMLFIQNVDQKHINSVKTMMARSLKDSLD